METVSGSDMPADAGPGLEGWEFTPCVDVVVSALGYFDGDQDGLLNSHRVGIFDTATTSQVVGAVIRPDSPLDGKFRWEAVSPVVLKAGHAYRLAGQNLLPLDNIVHGRGTWAPELERGAYCGGGRYVITALSYPQKISEAKDVFLDANFKYKPVSAD